jgi:CDP-alcohol phosphatidyltransferase
MFAEAKAVYLATRKKNDQLFNTYFMRPIAGFVVTLLARTPATPNQVTLLATAVFVLAAVLLVAMPTGPWAWVGVLVVELSYLFDCCDGMLARHKKIASQQGHLFDFFTDEVKALMLVGALGLRLWRSGGFGVDATAWAAGDHRFLIGGMAGIAIIASATSLTNFVRRPEISGRETPVSAHYETVSAAPPRGIVRYALDSVFTFLRFLNHYPSHLWLFALLGRLDLFFWVYMSINGLYLARGWLGLVIRFGRPPRPTSAEE